MQSLYAQNVAQRGGRQQSCRVLSVGHAVHRGDRIEDAIVDDGVDSDGHRVLREYLLGRHVERDRAQVNYLNGVHARQNEEETGSFGTAAQIATKAKDDRPLELFDNFYAKANAKRERHDHEQIGEHD